MLSREDNELLCRVGRGTPMGNLLRHYWMPCLPSTELPAADGPPVKVRLLGEARDVAHELLARVLAALDLAEAVLPVAGQFG